MAKAKQQETAEKATLTETDLFYIKNRAEVDTPEQIAEVVGVPIEQVLEHIPQRRKDILQVDTKKEPKTMMGRAMGKHKKGGVAVMTEAASQLGDATKQSRKKDYSNCIHRPND